jgi:hypothetical protein
VLPRDFDWGTLFARDQIGAVLNECGQKDPWPRFAGYFVARAGTAGSEGFDWFGETVRNERSEWFGHSDALMRTHIQKNWVPFLLEPPYPLAIFNGRNIKNGELFETWLDHTGTVIDVEAYGGLKDYEKVEIPRGLSTEWIRVNPDIYTFLVDREKQEPAGYINAMPVSDSAYHRLRNGELTDNEVTANDVIPFGESRSIKIYLMSIAVAEDRRDWGDGLFQKSLIQLLNGFVDKLRFYAKNNRVVASHLLATSWTDQGRQLCEALGLVEVGRDRSGYSIWELVLDDMHGASRRKLTPSLKRLLRYYDRTSSSS